MRPTRVLAVAVATWLAASAAGFVFVFGGAFTDGPENPLHPERLLSLGLGFGSLGLVAWGAARWGGGPRWAWALQAMAPAVVLMLLLAGDGLDLLWWAYLASACAGSWAGAALARWPRRGKQTSVG